MAREQDAEVLERGDIFFIYRPKTNEDEPAGLDDVQRFYLALRPAGGKHVRLCVAGRKHLPGADEHERIWGFVDMATDDEHRIEKALREEHHETRTRGEQELPAARPAGEGVYAILLEGGQMHLVYKLELPEKPDEVQHAFNIAPKASFALSVKNPEKGQPNGAGLGSDRDADYPKKLQQKFRDRRFDREDVELLNYEGAEFILVGTQRDPEAAYGIELDADHEDYTHSDTKRHMHMVKSRHPVAPLIKGSWE